MEFEWDPFKAERNLQKHGVAFTEATTVFADFLSVTVSDPDHSVDEERHIIVGTSHRGRLLIVCFTERSQRIRIISARELTQHERRDYEEGNFI